MKFHTHGYLVEHHHHKHGPEYSLMHALDPRVKILLLLSFVVFVVLFVDSLQQFLLAAFLLLLLVLLSNTHPVHVLKRSLMIVPFAGLVLVLTAVSTGEYARFFVILLRAWFAAIAVILLVETTHFPDLLKGFEKLGVPGIMVTLVGLSVQYFFVLAEEIQRMKRAMDSRSVRRPGMREAGNLVGALFLRTLERAERIYFAMASRGFSGKVKGVACAFRVTLLDAFFSLFFLSYMAVLWVVA
jgi:cobalt/nickel transport system permease protein